MLPVLAAIVLVLVSVNILLGVPKVVDLAQSNLVISSVPNNRVIGTDSKDTQVAGIFKRASIPKPQGLSVPSFSATAVILQDMDSWTLLFVKDPDKRVPIASTTKIMTALVAVDHYKANDELVVVPDALVSGSTMGLKAGERLTFRSLLYGMLLNSGNDAAYTIAANFPGGLPGFVRAMNDKALTLGLLNTHFDNPAGFDSPNHYSSAFDLAKIATVAMENYQFARVVGTKETEVASVDKSVVHQLKNLNKLLNTPGVLGIKTGTTPEAKENLVGLVERDNHKILTVVLGSDDRFGETQRLINWAYTNFRWE